MESGNAFDEIAPSFAPKSASSSYSSLQCDIFINHRGPDVKHTLARTIYHKLHLQGFQAFLDEEVLEAGDIIPQEIKRAIGRAYVHIAIFSPTYAESPWCLAELSLMLKTGTTIIPIFYHVDPSVLKWIARRVDESAQGISEHEKKGRYIPEKFIPEKLQKWLKALYDVYLRWFPSKVDKSALEKRIYVDAFSQHKEKDRYTPEKLQEWMKALHDVSFVSGYMIKDDSE
ncbi:TMV resistance protein N-like [Cryptomeria japonica]|uniref:TMV resistance protein N-like n=1 Tax=Cryptomeria japonica TaxID=3369 RepID=UPI0027DA4074|nr:TMV resistance protein N-like [Cryptomeria japonica]